MMKKALLILTFTVILMSAMPLYAQDPVEVAPEMYKILFENDQVRILDLNVEAGSKIPEHSHPNHFVYALTDGALSITKNGVTEELQANEGQVLWLNAATHSTVNTGTTEFHGLVVELKEK